MRTPKNYKKTLETNTLTLDILKHIIYSLEYKIEHTFDKQIKEIEKGIFYNYNSNHEKIGIYFKQKEMILNNFLVPECIYKTENFYFLKYSIKNYVFNLLIIPTRFHMSQVYYLTADIQLKYIKEKYNNLEIKIVKLTNINVIEQKEVLSIQFINKIIEKIQNNKIKLVTN